MKPLGFDYGVYPEDKVDSLSFCAVVFLYTFRFGVQRTRSRPAAKRFRLGRGSVNRAKRGFILLTEAFTRVTCYSV